MTQSASYLLEAPGQSSSGVRQALAQRLVVVHLGAVCLLSPAAVRLRGQEIDVAFLRAMPAGVHLLQPPERHGAGEPERRGSGEMLQLGSQRTSAAERLWGRGLYPEASSAGAFRDTSEVSALLVDVLNIHTEVEEVLRARTYNLSKIEVLRART